MTKSTSIQVAVLAGGQSRRMGQDKSFVLLDGKPLIEHVLEIVKILELDISIITNKPELYKSFSLPCFTDIIPNTGSLGGLFTALETSKHDFVLTVACDMPFLNPELLQYLMALRADYEAVIPVVGGVYQNLHAVYARQSRLQMREQIEQQEFRISKVHDALKLRRVEEAELLKNGFDLRSFINLNTRQELAEAESYGKL